MFMYINMHINMLINMFMCSRISHEDIIYKKGSQVNKMENVVLFDLNEIDNKRNKTLQKSTNLIQKAKHSLTAKELTLVDFMVTNVKETDDDFFTIETTIAELNEICKFGHGGAAHLNTEKALLNLANKGFWIELPDGVKTIGRWLDKPYIKNGRVKLRLDSDLAPYLLNLVEGQSTRLFFMDVVNLKSIHAKKLYEYLQSCKPDNEIFLSVNEVKFLFQKEHLEWYRVLPYLRKAKEDINSRTTMKIDYQTVKEGRSTIGIKIMHSKKKSDFID